MSRCIKPRPISTMSSSSSFVLPHVSGNMFTAAAMSAVALGLGNKLYFYKDYDYGFGELVKDKELYAQAVSSLAAEWVLPWLEDNMSAEMRTAVDPFIKSMGKPLVVGGLMLAVHKFLGYAPSKNAMQVVFGSAAAELVGASVAPMTLNRIVGV